MSLKNKIGVGILGLIVVVWIGQLALEAWNDVHWWAILLVPAELVALVFFVSFMDWLLD